MENCLHHWHTVMDMPTHVSCMLACIDCAQTCASCMPCTCRPTTGARVQTVATLAAFSPRCADRVFGGSGLVPNIAIAGKKMCTSAITDEAWLPLRRRWLACTEARGCMALLLTPWLGPQGENTRRFLCERTYVECCIQPVLRGGKLYLSDDVHLRPRKLNGFQRNQQRDTCRQ